ncbi:ABC transporter substrate-binding protein [Shewanella sp. WXL01]|uniref:substrate-binding periplasmic protein n=1 Tax=Shewanella sp. WXL01 TaxID=2709721 RepID=UPI001FD9AAD8|nr:transporter substrate-binding domain-containing protein [Shewanella sp. WXL01]
MPFSTSAKPIINVGGYEFSPYVTQENDGHFSGLTIDLIAALNQVQNEVEFNFVPTSIEQRTSAYSINRFDLMLFESPQWGWQTFPHEFIPLNVDDGEVFIALKSTAKSQQFFKSIKNKTLSLVRGYHYQFAALNPDASALEKDFRVQFVNSNHASIESILLKRAQVAPVTWSYLQHYYLEFPDAKTKLLVSNFRDQQYQHGVILNPQSKVSRQQLSKWLKRIKQKGMFERLLNAYQLTSR